MRNNITAAEREEWVAKNDQIEDMVPMRGCSRPGHTKDSETCADRLGRKAAQDRTRDRAIVEGRRAGTSDEGVDHGADPRCY